MSEEWLLNLAAPLHQLGHELGIAGEIWSAREELGQIQLSEPLFPRNMVLNLTAGTVALLTQTYGDAFRCRFKLGGLAVLTIDASTGEESLADYRKETADSPTVELDLALDKARLVQERADCPVEARLILYLHPEALERFLTSDLQRLESLVWGPDPVPKAVFLVPSRDIWLNGDHLAVVGGKHSEGWRRALAAAIPDRNGTEAWYEECRRRVHWQTEHVRHLTPGHWRVRESSGPGDTIQNAIRVQGFNTALLYLADQTTSAADGRWSAVFEGEGSRTTVGQGNPAEPLADAAQAGVDTWQEIVAWAYQQPWAADRLKMTRKNIGQALEGTAEAERLARLMAAAPTIRRALDFNWEAFTAEKIDKYYNQVKALEDDVRATVKSYADQIAGLIKGLSDTVLAAVGVVIGSFVAALFKDPFKPAVFQIGMIAYAVYVLVFPLIYNMLNQWSAYRALADGFELRRRRFEIVLFPERVKTVLGDQISSAEKRFEAWFRAAAIAYVVVIVLALLAAWLIPLNVQAITAAVSPGAAATPIATPMP